MRNLLEEYVPRVYAFALRLTGDPHAAEDLTQEAFLRAWRRRGHLRDPVAARVWLFRITANLWRDQLRRGKARVARAVPLTDDHAGKDSTPERAAAEQDDVRRVLEALDELPDRQREVLYLSAWEGLSPAAIAEVLGVRPESVRASLSLARRKMREGLRDLFEDLFPAKG